ncbi:ABC transporter permease [Bacillus massiliigorillae]|uniref:ABC transporter permease n=1 Tax=Bacillus massiliigorillae TaxID=1243664 RepID=UPI0003A3B4AD|nr:ABC transporter permease [Bacillus massiliigorillae]
MKPALIPDNMKKLEDITTNDEKGSGKMESYVYDGDPLNDDVIKEVMNTNGIDDYSARNQMFPDLKTLNGQGLKVIGGSEIFKNNPEYDHSVMAEAQAGTQGITLFRNDVLKMLEGSKSVEDKLHGALISKELADLNGLKIGDEIVLAIGPKSYDPNLKKGSLKLKVTGIFAQVKQQENAMKWSPAYRLENRIFINSKLMEDFTMKHWNAAGYDRVYFRVNDPAKMKEIMKKLKNNNNINWKYYSIEPGDGDYQKVASSLKNMDSLLTTLIGIIIVIGMAILTLILTMWMKSRIHETGILLSIGISKKKIVLQHIVEIVIVAVFAFGVSFFSSQMIAQGIGNKIVQQTNSQMEVSGTKDNNQNEIPTGDPDDFEPTFSAPKITELKIQVSPSNLLLVYSFGTLIAVFAVGISSIPVLRLKPKEIMSKMS